MRAALVLLALFVAGCQGARSGGSASTATGTPAVLSPSAGSTLPNATVGALYSQTITVLSGGGAPYSMSVSNPPPGIVLVGSSPTGIAFVLSGTPTVAGIFQPQARVVDGTGFVTLAGFTLTVDPAPSSIGIAPPSLAAAQVNTAYTQTLTALAGVPPFTWSIGTGALPSGLVLGPGPNATTTISGVPAFGGTSTFTVNVIDSSAPPLKGSTFYALTVH